MAPDWDDDILDPKEDTDDVPALEPEFQEELKRVSGADTEEWESSGEEGPPLEGDSDSEADSPPAKETAGLGGEPATEPENDTSAESPGPESGDDKPEESPSHPAEDPEGADDTPEESPSHPAEDPEGGRDEPPSHPAEDSEADSGEPEQPEEEPEPETAGESEPDAEQAKPAIVATAAEDAEDPDEDLGKPRRPVWLKFLGASFLIVISFTVATSTSLLLYLSDIASGLGDHAQLKGVQNQLANVQGGAPETIMVIGSDKRASDAKHSYGRSDTTILLRLDPNRDVMALFSIPRDLKVNIPGHGIDKFNAAYADGGPKLTLKVVKQLTGLQINHLVNVDFQGFIEAINAIGCVYADVDRNYFHSNKGLPAALQYSEIHVQAGYQRLCGDNALAFVRYRHTDTDIVRSARQQDFLREARQAISPAKLFFDLRKTLIHIFTKYTSSDINDPEAMLQVLKLFIASRNEPIHEVHFQGHLGPSYVTSSQAQIQKAVHQFLGFKATGGPRGTLKKSEVYASVPAAASGGNHRKRVKKIPATHKAKHKPKVDSKGLEDTTNYARRLARLAQPDVSFPIYYPTKLVPGSTYPQRPRVYNITSPDKSKHYRAIKWVFKTPVLGEYYGIMGTTWKDPPILKDSTSTKSFQGRQFKLYYDGDRLRLVAWQTGRASYWVSNSLLQTLSQKQMLGIAARTAKTTPHAKKRRHHK